jgi:hypothetical protein
LFTTLRHLECCLQSFVVQTSFCEETQSLSDIHAKIANVMNQANEEQQKAAQLMFQLYKQVFARHLRHKVFELA